MLSEVPTSARTARIPLSEPRLAGNEWKYVRDCLDSGWVSSAGAYVERFEKEFAGAVGARHAVAVVNGTAALHLALLVAGVRPDDEVLVSTLTFVAPANAVRYVGAWPVLVDAEPRTWQMDPERVVDFLVRRCDWSGGVLRNRATGRRVSALLPVHILGHPVEMAPLIEAARKYNLRLIEDASESVGARYRSAMVGSLGDIACFSFNGNKVITCGGGGMVVTDREEWAAKARYLSTQAKDDPVEYDHHEIGYNYRLTNVLAAIGCAQLEQLPEYLRRKREIAAAYREALGDVPGLAAMPEAPWAESACWLYTVLVDPAEYGRTSRQLLAQLRDRGIESRPLWRTMHRLRAHAKSEALGGAVAERLTECALSLPCSVGLTAAQQQRVADIVAALRQDGRS